MPAFEVGCMLPPGAAIAPPGCVKPGGGRSGLLPALPSSVAPSGIRVRPTADDEEAEDGVFALPAQESELPPERPPPSNRALEVRALPRSLQAAAPMVCEGMTGDIPGFAISVEPSGIPARWVRPELNGKVAPRPGGVCMFAEKDA
jgi:hypothetical protein